MPPGEININNHVVDNPNYLVPGEIEILKTVYDFLNHSSYKPNKCST